MPTRRRMSIAFARPCFFETRPWARRPSTICHPTVCTGFSAVDGSWNTIPTSRPRARRSSSAEMESTSTAPAPVRSLRSTAPSVTAVSGRRPRIVRAVTDLPDPDSPTMARISPGDTVRDTPSTARTSPPSVAKVTPRSRIETTSLMRTPSSSGRACGRAARGRRCPSSSRACGHAASGRRCR